MPLLPSLFHKYAMRIPMCVDFEIFFSAIRKTRQGIIESRKSFYATDKNL